MVQESEEVEGDGVVVVGITVGEDVEEGTFITL